MSQIPSESLNWLEQIATIESMIKKAGAVQRPEIQKALNVGKSQVSDLLSIKDCFDKGARDRIRQAALANPPFVLSFSSAVPLTRLKGQVENVPKAINEVLDVIFKHQLATKDIKALVAFVVSGKPAEEFDPENIGPEVTPSPKPKATGSPTPKPATAPSSETIDQDQAEEGSEIEDDTDTEEDSIQASAKSKSAKTPKHKAQSGGPQTIAIPKFITNPIKDVGKETTGAFSDVWHWLLHIYRKVLAIVIICLLFISAILVAYERLIEHHSFHWCFETMVSSITKTNDQPVAVEAPKPVTQMAAVPTIQPQVTAQVAAVPPPAKAKAKKHPSEKIIFTSDETTKLALDFVTNYYGISYKNLDDMMDYFHKWLNDSYEDTFMDKVLPTDRRHEIKDQKLVLSFKPTQPVKYLKEGPTWDEVLVQGTLTTRCEKEEGTVTVTTESVSLAIGVMHTGSSDGPICEVREVE
jgi:hypothetical protein